MSDIARIPGTTGLAQPPDSARRGRRVLVIANPTAGNARRTRLEHALRTLEALDCRVHLRLTESAGHAVALARDAALSNGFDVVVAAGGDGTINEVVNGLCQAGSTDVNLGILPLGTANVLAIEAGVPRSIGKAARLIATGSGTRLFPGEVHFGTAGTVRRFVMMAGTGFDAHVVKTLDPAFKRRAGKFAYVWSALRRAFSYRFPLCALEVENPEMGTVRFSSATTVVCKGRHYGGGFVAAPRADISVPTFQVLVLPRPGIFNLARYAWGLGAGRLSQFPDVRIVEATRVRILSGSADVFQLDGDSLTDAVSEITVAERPLSLIARPPPVALAA